jgi:hypothetical protein
MSARTLLVIGIAGWLCTSCAAATPVPSAVSLQSLFRAAASRDSARLLQIEPSVAASSDPTLGIGLPIALYVADPTRFAQRFAESFPTSYGELMTGLYPIELASVLPEHGFAVRALGQLARSGNGTAARKIILALSHSDGAVSETLFEELAELLPVRPRAVVRAFTLLTNNEQTSVLGSLRRGLPNERAEAVVQALSALQDLSADETVAADVIRSAVQRSR